MIKSSSRQDILNARNFAEAVTRVEQTQNKKATALDLSGLGLTELPDAIGQLTQLENLNLAGNKLDVLPDFISLLSQLKDLYLSNNQLIGLSESIGQLTQLRELYISANQLIVLPESIGKLTRLRILKLENNQLTTLPTAIGKLTQLQSLTISDNQLTLFPDFLGHLTQLQMLSFSGNQLTVLPAIIGQLTQLRELYISKNQLILLPESIGNLTKLQVLDLIGNRLVALPESLRNLKSLKELYLHENKMLGLPIEVLGPTQKNVIQKSAQTTKPSKILDYYFRVRGGKRPLNEAKLILVGRGAVGKTSLANRLVYDRFDQDVQKTEGISITEWKFCLDDNEDIRLNIWDFGGQEIMHATHQFFLTQRSLYLLVLNGREGVEDADAEYWLKLIDSFGGDSPVIVVLNKIKDHPFDLNRRGLQQKYAFIHDFIKTDCKDGTGIAELRQIIARETDLLPDLRAAFPTSWFTIKDQLAVMKKNYVSFNEYRAFCAQHGEKDKTAQEALAGYLHTLGIVLNYKDDPRLQDTHVLNPHWVTNGIYKILNSSKLEKQKGEISLHELAEILNEKDYPATMRRFILDLMKKFDLCFNFPDNERHYLIPELLDKQEPEEAAVFKPETCLNFQYHYSVLPEGLLPRFIVRTHALSDGLPRWRTGVILEFEGCRAFVKADVQDKKVFISVSGPVLTRRRLLAAIRSDFDRIHHDIRHLLPDEMVPLPEHPNVVIPYKKLLVMEQRGVQQFTEVVGHDVIEIDVQELLNGIDLEGTRKKEQTMEERRPAIRVFISYSHKDESLRNELLTHLKLLQRQGIVDTWDDRRIDSAEDWRLKVDENLERADIILLLVSADFLASDYCYEKEVARALERHENGEVKVIPIIVRDVNWMRTPFAKLQVLPKDGKAISKWQDKDSAWREVSEGITIAAKELRIEEIDLSEETIIISGVHLENIRCFENLDLSFKPNNDVKQFILLFGENSVGKTTLLRSIALGLCDQVTAAALIKNLPGDWLRKDKGDGIISLNLTNSAKTKEWTAKTVLSRNSEGTITVKQNVTPRHLPRDQVFACGYGAGRRGFGSQDYSEYSLKSSLDTLFNYDTNLQNPELVLRRIEATGTDVKKLTKCIDAVLMLEPESTRMENSGIQVKGPWGDLMPLGGLGDGYQATLGWVADMLGWALFYEIDFQKKNSDRLPSNKTYKPAFLRTQISGVVLIDELEQHLHPSWQREIIHLLHHEFPKIQFIATSHSPMCALGTTALKDSTVGIVRLYQKNNQVVASPFETPKSHRADQVLISPLFGLFSAAGFDVSADIQQYAKLASRSNRSKEDDAKLSELRENLYKTLGPFKNEIEQRIEATVQEALKKELKSAIESGELTAEELDMQIRYWLQKLFNDGAEDDSNLL